jgi:NAD(P)-dependent dehydrogenase (short-subunit alcohol dehydrogenase family)
LVTGAASGIGRAAALGLAEHGATLAVADLDAVGVRDVADEIVAAGGRAEAFPTDLADPAAPGVLVPAVVAAFGSIDVLVNGAGTPDTSGILDGSLDVWERVYRVNVTAPFLLMQAVGRQLVAQRRGGRIVNVGSSSAFRAHAAGAAYGSSKAALSALTRIAAAELAPHDVNVNAVAPGLTRTAMVTAALDDDAIQAAVRSGSMANMFERVSEPADIAAVIVFLCLPDSRQITAQTVHVSAGAVI